MFIAQLKDARIKYKNDVRYEDVRSSSTDADIIIDRKNKVIYLKSDGRFVGYWQPKTGADLQCGQQYYLTTVHNALNNMGLTASWGIFCEHDFTNIKSRKKTTIIGKRLINLLSGKEVNIKKLFEPIKDAKNELGVELELESERGTTIDRSVKEQVAKDKKYIQDIGHDCSVFGDACEIRFNHPSLKDWKFKDVKRILDTMKSAGATTDYDSAGMHIHISHKMARKCVARFEENLKVMQDILYPINCRHKYKRDWDRSDKDKPTTSKVSYGVGINIYHNQVPNFGTLEIRAWRATLNPKMFMARLRFAKKLMDYLASNRTVSVRDFFKTMTPKQKLDYLYMLESPENPHEWGKSPTAIKRLLLAA